MDEDVKEVKNESDPKSDPKSNPKGYTIDELERFEIAYQRHGRNATKAAIEVRPQLAARRVLAGKVGERMLNKIETDKADVILALRRRGYGSNKIAEGIIRLLESKKIIKSFVKDGNLTITEEDNVNGIDRGVTHMLKIGVGGGYKAEEIRQSGMIGHAHFSLIDLLDKAREKEERFRLQMSPEEYDERLKTKAEELKNEE